MSLQFLGCVCTLVHAFGALYRPEQCTVMLGQGTTACVRLNVGYNPYNTRQQIRSNLFHTY